MGRFWMEDKFVREDARSLSIYATGVFMCLCSHADESGHTFVGVRRIGKELGISKDTALKALRELEASHHIGRSVEGNGKPSYITVHTVLYQHPQPSYRVGHKEGIKESKEEGVYENYRDKDGRAFVRFVPPG